MTSTPTREDYDFAVDLLNGNRGAIDFDTNFSAADLEVARQVVRTYEAQRTATTDQEPQ